eukprot:SAG11_NODE_342_length_10454_cov_11.233079_1_plen_363_part_00
MLSCAPGRDTVCGLWSEARLVAAVGPMPPARRLPMSWAAPDGALLLYGGEGFGPPGDASVDERGFRSDVWSRPKAAGSRWVKLAAAGHVAGASGPAARSAGAVWQDRWGNAHLFGGKLAAVFGTSELWAFSAAVSAGSPWVLLGGAAAIGLPADLSGFLDYPETAVMGGWPLGRAHAAVAVEPTAAPDRPRLLADGRARSCAGLLFGGLVVGQVGSAPPVFPKLLLSDLWGLECVSDSYGRPLNVSWTHLRRMDAGGGAPTAERRRVQGGSKDGPEGGHAEGAARRSEGELLKAYVNQGYAASWPSSRCQHASWSAVSEGRNSLFIFGGLGVGDDRSGEGSTDLFDIWRVAFLDVYNLQVVH